MLKQGKNHVRTTDKKKHILFGFSLNLTRMMHIDKKLLTSFSILIINGSVKIEIAILYNM